MCAIFRIHGDMFEKDALVKRVEQYAANAGIAESTASFRVFGSGDQLERLQGGASCRLNTAAKAWTKLDALEAKLSEQAA